MNPEGKRLCDLGKTLLVQNGKLIHRRFPVWRCPRPVLGDIAQCQPDQFGGRIITGEMPSGLEYLAQPGVHTLNRIGRIAAIARKTKPHPNDATAA